MDDDQRSYATTEQRRDATIAKAKHVNIKKITKNEFYLFINLFVIYQHKTKIKLEKKVSEKFHMPFLNKKGVFFCVFILKFKFKF